jgi:hypothetical protein
MSYTVSFPWDRHKDRPQEAAWSSRLLGLYKVDRQSTMNRAGADRRSISVNLSNHDLFILARARRELEEFQAVLEAEPQRGRRGNRPAAAKEEEMGPR